MELVRRRVAELMDDASLDAARHRVALRGLARLNAVSRVDRHIWRLVATEARRAGHRLRVLDVATGSGDLLLRLAHRARREGIDLELHACDISAVALDAAREAADAAKVTLHAHQLDVLAQPLPGGFDIAHCGLFLHHLDPPQVEMVLRRMAQAAGVVIVQDLNRTLAGLALARVAPRVLTRSRVVHIDAVRSVHAAFTIEEMTEMARRAGLAGARVRPIWPERQLLVWERMR